MISTDKPSNRSEDYSSNRLVNSERFAFPNWNTCWKDNKVKSMFDFKFRKLYIISLYGLGMTMNNLRLSYNVCNCNFKSYTFDHICGVMVSVLASSAVDRGFEPQSGQTKDYRIGICCFSSKHAAFR